MLPASAPLLPLPPHDDDDNDALLEALLDLSDTGVALYAPLYDGPAGELTDLRFVRLNLAAQALLGLPAVPAGTYQQEFAASNHPAAFEFHRTAFLANGAPAYSETQALNDGRGTAYQLVARRVGRLLLVRFSTAAQARPDEEHPDPARRQVQQLNYQLQAANAELLRNNAALIRTQQAVQQANTELAQERAMLAQVFAQTPALIALLTGPDFIFSFVNPAFQRLFPGRQFVGRPYAEIMPEAWEQGYGALLHKVYTTGKPLVGKASPLHFTDTEGQQRNTFFDFTYEIYDHGAGRGIFLFAFEVTDQVLSRQERNAQQQQLQDVFEQAPVAICVFRGPEYVLDVVNPSMGELWSRLPAELVGRPFFEMLPELREQGIWELLEQVRLTGQPYVAQARPIALARHAPGEVGYYDFVCQPVRSAAGHDHTIVCVATEVTRQVLARRLVEEREQGFRQMADNAPAMLWVTDPAGYCTYLNQPWYDYTGQTEAEALGMGWTEAVHPDDNAATATAFVDANNRQVPFYSVYRLRRHDGRYRWAVDRGQPHFSAKGEYQGMVGTVIEVHEQKLAELALQRLTAKLRTSRDEAQALNAELRSANAQLTRTNVDLDNFIYTASHDLRAPITNIEGLLMALREQLPADVQHDEQVQPLLGMMESAVERFQLTIEQLSDISQLQLTHAQPAAPQNLAALAQDVRLDLAPILEAASAHIILDVAECPTLLFAPKNLRSILYNLLSNAVKYRHPDRPPQVLLRAYRHGQSAVLEVHDNGLGLSDEQQVQLFGMFRRLHDHVEGSGIGLYMVKKIVENAGGTIAVRSEPGVGSVFVVTLPA